MDTEIKQIMPVPFKIMAIYGDEKIGVYRSEVICLAPCERETPHFSKVG